MSPTRIVLVLCALASVAPSSVAGDDDVDHRLTIASGERSDGRLLARRGPIAAIDPHDLTADGVVDAADPQVLFENCNNDR